MSIFFIVFIFLILQGTSCIQAKSLELHEKVIILDPGHAIDTTNKYAGYGEQVTMLKLAQKIKPLLESRGATVYLTRETYEPVLLAGRAAKINIWSLEAIKDARQPELTEDDDIGIERDIAEVDDSVIKGEGGDFFDENIDEIDTLLQIMQSIVDDPKKNGEIYMNTPFTSERGIHPDLERVFKLQGDSGIGDRFLVVSLHSNATRAPINSSVNGASVFHISSSHRNTSNYYTGYSFTEQSRRFGSILLDHIEAAGIRKRNLAIENYFMIREHNLPGVLVENGFHTNDKDREKLSDDTFLDNLALAYLDAITVYFNDLPLTEPFPALPYTDVQNDAWYYDAVNHVSRLGLLVGTSPDNFSPDDGMTRAMLTTVLSRLEDEDVSANTNYTKSPYSDIIIDAWYAKAVAWAADMGIVGFISSQVFMPGQHATREEIAQMIYNYLCLRDMTIYVESSADTTVESDFELNDDGDISQWAKIAIYALWEYGVMRGDERGFFYPKKTATRAEAAQIFSSVLMLLPNGE
jgi:N-acetylmuramoyl-L-alanine amidase